MNDEEAQERQQIINQIKSLDLRSKELAKDSLRREEIDTNKAKEIENQNAALRNHIRVLDRQIKKLSLLHSQLSAAPQYKLAKTDVDEILRLISTI